MGPLRHLALVTGSDGKTKGNAADAPRHRKFSRFAAMAQGGLRL